MFKFIGTNIILTNIRYKINISIVSYWAIVFQALLKIINLPHTDNQGFISLIKNSAYETSRISLITKGIGNGLLEGMEEKYLSRAAT